MDFLVQNVQKLGQDVIQLTDEDGLWRILGKVDQGGTTVGLNTRIHVVVKDHEQAWNDLGVVLLLERGRKVSGHLANAVAGRISDSWMRVLEESDDAVDHLVQIGFHLLVSTLGSRRQCHQTGVSVFPVGC